MPRVEIKVKVGDDEKVLGAVELVDNYIDWGVAGLDPVTNKDGEVEAFLLVPRDKMSKVAGEGEAYEEPRDLGKEQDAKAAEATDAPAGADEAPAEEAAGEAGGGGEDGGSPN